MYVVILTTADGNKTLVYDMEGEKVFLGEIRAEAEDLKKAMQDLYPEADYRVGIIAWD